MRYAKAHLRKIVESFTGKKVLVVGDVMLDEYVWGKASRISPEAPVMVVKVERSSSNPGGAANVAVNVVRLGGEAAIVGAVGDDDAGERLRTDLADVGILSQGLVRAPGRPTTVKTRIIAHSQQVVRIDKEEPRQLDAAAATELIRRAQDLVDWADAVLISDYDKGVIPACCEPITSRAAAKDLPVTSNPKPGNLRRMRGGTLCSLNQVEAEAASQLRIEDEDTLAKAAKTVRRIAGTKWTLITRGEQGMDLFGRNGKHVAVPGIPVEVYDVAGAGDSVIAVLTLALAAGADAGRAAALANYAGATVVRHVGVAAATQREIIDLIATVGSHA
jgi:rfaE bifunctional protein kinase chain/domain